MDRNRAIWSLVVSRAAWPTQFFLVSAKQYIATGEISFNENKHKFEAYAERI